MIFASIGRSQYEIPAELLDHGLAPLAIPMVAMGWVGNFLELLLAPNDTPARPCARIPAGQDGGDQAARVAFMVDLFGEAGGGCRRPSGSAFSAPNCWARRRRIGKISSWAYIPMGFYTGAAGLPGRFREGFCLRRVQTCSQYPQSGSPTSHRRPGVAREAIHPPCPKREDIPGNQAQEASPFDTK